MRGPVPEPEARWKKPDGSLYPGSKVASLKEVTGSDAGAWNCTFDYDGHRHDETLDISVTGGSLTFAEHPPKKSCRFQTRLFSLFFFFCFQNPPKRP